MKKNLLSNIFALMGIVFSQATFASAAHFTPNDDPRNPNLIGYMNLPGENVRPAGISMKADGSLMVTAVGDFLTEGDSGQIWDASSSDKRFHRAKIESHGQDLNTFTSSVYSEDRGSLFVCSIPSKSISMDSLSPSIIELKKDASGSYVWTSVMNFSEYQKQFCKGIAIVGKTLFAVNPSYLDSNSPALYYADISASELPANMTVAQTYADLGINSGDMVSLKTNYPVADVVASPSQEDGKISLFLLDRMRSSIDSITFQSSSGMLSRDGEVKVMPFGDMDMEEASALACLDDHTFFVAAGSTGAPESLAKIYKLHYDKVKGQLQAQAEFMGEAYSVVSDMVIGNDHLGATADKVLFASLFGHDNDRKYNIAEYKLEASPSPVSNSKK